MKTHTSINNLGDKKNKQIKEMLYIRELKYDRLITRNIISVVILPLII